LAELKGFLEATILEDIGAIVIDESIGKRGKIDENPHRKNEQRCAKTFIQWGFCRAHEASIRNLKCLGQGFSR
jgi:hypothetical protein